MNAGAYDLGKGKSGTTRRVNVFVSYGTLVYQVDRTNGIVTVSPVNSTPTAGQTTIQTNLVANAPVKVFGVPQPAGSIKAYVLFYYTGVASTN